MLIKATYIPNSATTPILHTMTITHSNPPYHQGYLPSRQGHTLFFAEYGCPDAPVSVVLHGGPGSSCNTSMLKWFDLATQRVVLFDQRGAGRSLPSGLLTQNTTSELIEDIEHLRTHLQIERWLVIGGSWGALLAILYTGKHPERVNGLILRGVFLAHQEEMIWFFQSIKALIPDAWSQLTEGWTVQQRQNVLQNLTEMLLNGTTQQQWDATLRWSHYENSIMAAMLGQTPPRPSLTPPSKALCAKYRIQAHYLSQACFTNETELMENAMRIPQQLPVILIHGTHDWICPPANAVRVKAMLAHTDLRWCAKGTHTPQDPGILAALQNAIAQHKPDIFSQTA